MEGDLQRRLGRSLRTLRTRTGLSQEAFADLLGIHRTYIGGLERGERNVTLQTVERIAERLEVGALTLLDGSADDADEAGAGERPRTHLGTAGGAGRPRPRGTRA